MKMVLQASFLKEIALYFFASNLVLRWLAGKQTKIILTMALNHSLGVL